MANTTKRPVIDEPPGFSEAWDRLTAGSLPKFTGRKQAYAEFFRAGLNMRSNWIEPKPIVTRKIPAAGRQFERGVRRHCCGVALAERGPGGNWGDWKCRRCGTAYCQDCGAQINMWTMQCTAYEESQDAKDDVA